MMRALAWVFTLMLVFAGGVLGAFAWLYPEARYGIFGLGPFPLWLWMTGALLWGALLVFLWLPALHLRAAAERRRLRRELQEVRKELEALRREHPEEVPRIPDRDPEE